MLPKALVWQEIRKRALDTVRPDSVVSFASPPTLESWLKVGSFHVAGISKKCFVLHAASSEIGAALFSETILSADRALEHSVTLRNQLACQRWSSPAWTAVTFYYWAYHLAVALTRLLGKTTWFVTRDLAAQLYSLAGTAGSNPGAGPYSLECGAYLSSTVREIMIKRSQQTRSHDAVWGLWHSELRTCTQAVAALKAGDAEARFYLSIARAANSLGETWPSELRNALNYTNAHGYGAVRHRTPSAVYGTVPIDPPSTVGVLIGRLEQNVAGLDKGLPLVRQLGAATRVLVDLTFSMDVLLRELIQEVMERRRIDRRWAKRRADFAKLHAKGFSVEDWPCQGDDEAA